MQCIYDIVCSIITVSGFCLQMIKINSRIDERISQCFPNDPYSNLCILTTSQKLYLQHAFLSMDSTYFARIDPDARQVDLQELPQDPLIRILHSLYGEELIVNSMGELAELLPIILYLDIQQYRSNIEKQILQMKDLLENVQLIELSFKHQFLWNQIVHVHINNNLAHLENSKCYLQIGKLSNEAFNALVLQYIQKTGCKNEKILNSVMQNYFNRKNIKPILYLQSHHLDGLLKIWMNYHHAYQSPLPIYSEKIVSNGKVGIGKQEKLARIKKLEEQTKTKDQLINNLQTKIKGLKQELGIRQKLATARSLFIQTEAPTSKQKLSNQRNKKSPQFRSCIYNEQPNQQKRSPSYSRWKIYNRLGSKNIMRRW